MCGQLNLTLLPIDVGSLLPLNLSDTAATSQDGSSQPLRVGNAIFRMQVAEGCAHPSMAGIICKRPSAVGRGLSMLIV